MLLVAVHINFWPLVLVVLETAFLGCWVGFKHADGSEIRLRFGIQVPNVFEALMNPYSKASYVHVHHDDSNFKAREYVSDNYCLILKLSSCPQPEPGFLCPGSDHMKLSTKFHQNCAGSYAILQCLQGRECLELWFVWNFWPGNIMLVKQWFRIFLNK